MALDRRRLRAAGQNLFKQGLALMSLQLLGQVADDGLVVDRDHAAVGRDASRDHLQERRLPGTVGSYQRDPVLKPDPKGDALEQHAAAEALGYLLNRDHRYCQYRRAKAAMSNVIEALNRPKDAHGSDRGHTIRPVACTAFQSCRS